MQLPERTINPNKRILVTRRLPVPGRVLVQRGQSVQALQVIAKADLPQRYRVIDVARQLGHPEVDMGRVMLKAESDWVQAGEAVAAGKGLPFLRKAARAPADGRIAALGQGWVLLETGRTEFELQAFVNGTVTRVIPHRGVVIETTGAMVEAACGFGGEAYGPLQRLVDRPFESLQAGMIGDEVRHCILLGGRTLDEETLRVAAKAEVRGIIVGSFDASLLKLDPPVKVRVVATEGFGDVAMSAYTFGLLGTLDGKEVSIRGHTPAVTGSNSDEDGPVILTSTGRQTAILQETAPPVQPGRRVRVTCGRLLGASGAIRSIPPAPQPTDAGIVAPGAYVEIENQVHYIPWANLELIV